MTNLIPSLAFFPNFQGWEIGIILAVIILLFGGKKLPELARGAGKAISEFKKARAEAEDSFREALDEDTRPRQTTASTAGGLKPDPAVAEPRSKSEA